MQKQEERVVTGRNRKKQVKVAVGGRSIDTTETTGNKCKGIREGKIILQEILN